MGWCAFRRSVVTGSAATLLAALAAGCGGPDTRWGEGHYKLGRPYQINGRWYRPEFDPAYDRVGVASWYGDAFDGLLTANGEIFNKDEISAAHPTMPLPSIARVTNLENGRSLDLRVNDRGPFVGDRMIDLSQAAARKLGFEQAGLARVRVRFVKLADARGTPPRAPDAILVAARREAPPALTPAPYVPPLRPPAVVAAPASPARAARQGLEPPSPPWGGPRAVVLADAGPRVPAPPAAAASPPPRPAVCPAGPQWVQVGAFADSVRVRSTAAALRGVERVVIEPYFGGGVALARVKLGPVPDLASALALLDRVHRLGYPGAFVAPATAAGPASC